ncbi:MAG: Crp/Fnr family transcriptional regulator [Bacteroidetes bacterium]|nr:Crp/Fnr family transcriptional regulator [Bacteroidota bacterium]
MEKLRTYLGQFCPLKEDEWQQFADRLQQRVFARKQIVSEAGKTEKYISFVESGIIRYFIMDGDKDITFEIAFENSFATVYDSFLTRLPALYTGEALTDVVLWSITWEDLQEMYRISTAADRIGRLAAEQLYIKKNKRQLSLLKDSAALRYRNLLNDYPHLIQHVPLKYLASYIGITPQALSRIRRRIY